jgi:RND family efflux transporter MFP subunit
MKYVLRICPALIIVLSMTWVGCTDKDHSEAQRPIAVRTVQPERRDMQDKLEYLGSIHSTTEIQVNAQLQGSIASLAVEEGDHLRRGTELLRLFVPDLEAAVERLSAERDYWRRRGETDERLFEQNAIPADQVDAGRRASTAASSAYREAVSRLDKAVEHSPIAGMVLRRFVEAGQNVMPGQPLLLIGSADREVRVNVVEEEFARGLRIGMKAQLVVDARTRIPASVVEIAPVTAGVSRSFTVKLRPTDGARLELRHGTSIAVNFLLRESVQALAVPVQALVYSAGEAAVFLVRGDRVIRQSVDAGIEEHGWVEAEFAWNGSDAVATSNLGSLSDSCRVLAVPVREDQR